MFRFTGQYIRKISRWKCEVSLRKVKIHINIVNAATSHHCLCHAPVPPSRITLVGDPLKTLHRSNIQAFWWLRIKLTLKTPDVLHPLVDEDDNGLDQMRNAPVICSRLIISESYGSKWQRLHRPIPHWIVCQADNVLYSIEMVKSEIFSDER